MKGHGERRTASSINVGNVQGTGIVIGHGSSASVEFNPSAAQREATALLDEFIRLLENNRSTIDDADDIRESAEAAKAELAAESPKWNIVRSLLRGIAAGVAGISTLAQAISNVQAIVAHLPT